MIDVEGLRTAITNAIDALSEVADQLPEPGARVVVRMSVDVPQALHRQIKSECAINGERISDAVRELIETYWPQRKAHNALTEDAA